MRLNLLAICGAKKTGKTTLIERLLPLLRREGLCVAVIKHDGHRYHADVPETDTHRFFSANASGVAIYDAEKYTITRMKKVEIADVLRAFSDMDLILIEGWKRSNCAKIEMIPDLTSGEPTSNPEKRLAFICACKTEIDMPVFHPDDLANIVSFLLDAYRAGQLKMDIRDIHFDHS